MGPILEKFKFRTTIDIKIHYQNTTQEKINKNQFSFTFNGYLLPEEFNGVSNTQRGFSPI